MPLLTNDEDRRRHQRVACGGQARISLLPSDGALYFGKLRDLSRGGTCLEMTCPLPVGVRAELLVCIGGTTFRTLGQVRALDQPRVSMEFLHVSAGGRDMLEELLIDFETLQKTMAKLRSDRLKSEADLSRQLKSAGINPAVLSSCRPMFTSLVEKPTLAEDERIEVVRPAIRIDLFG
ncbi:MAG: PilZ domain-containing protein [Terriglobales bacterium]|jgi:hypothetical protein